MKNILVVPCGTEIAHEIVRSLKDIKNVSVYGANSIDCYSEIITSNVSTDIAYINDNKFISEIYKLIKKWGITHIIPAHDSAALKLTQFADQINAKIVSSTYNTNLICRSKKHTYKVLEGIVCVPKQYNSDDPLEFPLFIKPDIGQGSVGVRLIRNFSELVLSDGDLLCEYLPGDEYTVDCVTDSQGNLLFSKARKRCLTRNGIAVESEIVKDQLRFIDFAQKINKKLELRGGWFFQVKENIFGELCLLEVATRIAGSMITNRFNGINFTELSLLIADKIPVSILDNNLSIKLYRNLNFQFATDLDFDTIYTDYDDCLLLENSKINTDLIKVLFNACNHGKKNILITRHKGDLTSSLMEHRLTGIFDEIIHILNPEEKKSLYIKNKKAIFIDDSFRERLDVASNIGIPCFSVDMIRGLSCLKN